MPATCPPHAHARSAWQSEANAVSSRHGKSRGLLFSFLPSAAVFDLDVRRLPAAPPVAPVPHPLPGHRSRTAQHEDEDETMGLAASKKKAKQKQQPPKPKLKAIQAALEHSTEVRD